MPLRVCDTDAVDYESGELQLVHRLRGRFDPVVAQRRDRHRAGLVAFQQRQHARQVAIPLALRPDMVGSRKGGAVTEQSH